MGQSLWGSRGMMVGTNVCTDPCDRRGEFGFMSNLGSGTNRRPLQSGLMPGLSVKVT